MSCETASSEGVRIEIGMASGFEAVVYAFRAANVPRILGRFHLLKTHKACRPEQYVLGGKHRNFASHVLQGT